LSAVALAAVVKRFATSHLASISGTKIIVAARTTRIEHVVKIGSAAMTAISLDIIVLFIEVSLLTQTHGN
jgi:hypothetical protein